MDAIEDLARRLPQGAVVTDLAERASRSRDWSALALLRSVRDAPVELPEAVVLPSSTEEVSVVLRWASATGTAVVPRGGGSGVCAGVAPLAESIVLDLSRMVQILMADPVSRLVHVQAGIRGEALEESLAGHGLTVGHYPQSISMSTVGGWIAAASAGQASVGYGAIEDLLMGLTAVLADGTVVRLRPVPRSAAGPDVRRLLVGSEGTLAVVTEAWLACAPRTPAWAWQGFRFGSFAACTRGLRSMHEAATGAAVLRGYDEVDAMLTFGGVGHPGGAMAIVGTPSDLPGLEARHAVVAASAASAGGEPAGPGYGEHWWIHRNDAVETYRRVMGPERSFGPGVVVDTMEVAAPWGDLEGLYEGVRDALAGHAEAVACHLSHAYRGGACLYFTFLVRGPDDLQVEEPYLTAWEEAVGACLRSGGTITHHHGVGRLKARFLEDELGEGGMEMLRRIKSALDPREILNPGALLPSTRLQSGEARTSRRTSPGGTGEPGRPRR